MPKITKRVIDSTAVADHDVFVWDSEIPGFGLRVKPSGVRTYILQFRNQQGRSRRLTIGRHGVLTPDEARKEARKLLGDVARGLDPAAARTADREAPTVGELCDRYIEQHAEPHKKPRSVEEDRRNIKLHIRPALGKKRVADVTRADVARLHHKMKGSPTGANRVLALLSTMFNIAEAWGMRPDFSNPCRRVKKFKEVARERYLSADELARLGEVLAETERAQIESATTIAAIRLLIFTGARKSEILSMRWRDVDVENGISRLPDSKTGAKNIYLSAPALSVLDGLDRGDVDEYVLTGRRSGGRFGALDQAWARIRKKAKLDDVRIHDLRHSFASVAVGLGEGLPIVGKILGHSVPQTTARYGHVAPDPARFAADRVGAAMEGMMRGTSGEVVKLATKR